MTIEQAKEFLPIIEAYVKGRIIQVLEADGKWGDIESPNFTGKAYRIKPEPNYVPYDFSNMLIGRIVKDTRGYRSMIIEQRPDRVILSNGSGYSYLNLMNEYTYLDDATVGKWGVE